MSVSCHGAKAGGLFHSSVGIAKSSSGARCGGGDGDDGGSKLLDSWLKRMASPWGEVLGSRKRPQKMERMIDKANTEVANKTTLMLGISKDKNDIFMAVMGSSRPKQKRERSSFCQTSCEMMRLYPKGGSCDGAWTHSLLEYNDFQICTPDEQI